MRVFQEGFESGGYSSGTHRLPSRGTAGSWNCGTYVYSSLIEVSTAAACPTSLGDYGLEYRLDVSGGGSNMNATGSNKYNWSEPGSFASYTIPLGDSYDEFYVRFRAKIKLNTGTTCGSSFYALPFLRLVSPTYGVFHVLYQKMGYAHAGSFTNSMEAHLGGYRRRHDYDNVTSDSQHTATVGDGAGEDQWSSYEIHFKGHATEGVYTFKKDGEVLYTFTGNTDTKGLGAAVSHIQLGFDQWTYYADWASDGRYGGSVSWFLDDIAVNAVTGAGTQESWCGPGSIVLIKPNSDSTTYNEWEAVGAGSGLYDRLDDLPIDNNTGINASGVGMKQAFGTEDMTGNYHINSLAVVAQSDMSESLRGLFVPQGGALLYNQGSGIVSAGANHDTVMHFGATWDNTEGGTPFTRETIEGAEFGIELGD